MKQYLHSLITYSVLSLSILSAIPATAQTVGVSSENSLKEMQETKFNQTILLEQSAIYNSEELTEEQIVSEAEINLTESAQIENQEAPKTSNRIPLRSQIFPTSKMQQ